MESAWDLLAADAEPIWEYMMPTLPDNCKFATIQNFAARQNIGYDACDKITQLEIDLQRLLMMQVLPTFEDPSTLISAFRPSL